MTNLISLATLVIFLFVFIANNLNWSFLILDSEVKNLDKGANLYLENSRLLINANLSDLKIGELD